MRKKIKEIWEKIKSYIGNNLERDHEKVLGGFGAWILVLIGAIIMQCILLMSGGIVDWGYAGAKILGGLEVFLILLIPSIFGRNNTKKKIELKEDK